MISTQSPSQYHLPCPLSGIAYRDLKASRRASQRGGAWIRRHIGRQTRWLEQKREAEAARASVAGGSRGGTTARNQTRQGGWPWLRLCEQGAGADHGADHAVHRACGAPRESLDQDGTSFTCGCRCFIGTGAQLARSLGAGHCAWVAGQARRLAEVKVGVVFQIVAPEAVRG